MKPKLSKIKMIKTCYILVSLIVTGIEIFKYVLVSILNDETLRVDTLCRNAVKVWIITTIIFSGFCIYRKYSSFIRYTVIILLMLMVGSAIYHTGNYYTYYLSQKDITDKYLEVITLDIPEIPKVRDMKNNFYTYPLLSPLLYLKTGVDILSHLAKPDSDLPEAYSTEFIKSRIDVAAISQLSSSSEREKALKSSIWYADAGTVKRTLEMVAKISSALHITVLLCVIYEACSFSDHMYRKTRTSFIDFCYGVYSREKARKEVDKIE